MRKLNVFFDVDNTIVLWNGRLRNHTREVFEHLHESGHKIYIWSGVGIRRWDMNHHDLAEFVEDYFVKPLDRYRERAYNEFNVHVPIHYVIDDHKGVVEAFDEGYHCSDSPKDDDREMLDILARIEELAAAPAPDGADAGPVGVPPGSA